MTVIRFYGYATEKFLFLLHRCTRIRKSNRYDVRSKVQVEFYEKNDTGKDKERKGTSGFRIVHAEQESFFEPEEFTSTLF